MFPTVTVVGPNGIVHPCKPTTAPKATGRTLIWQCGFCRRQRVASVRDGLFQSSPSCSRCHRRVRTAGDIHA